MVIKLKVIGTIKLNAKTAQRFLEKYPDKYVKDRELSDGNWQLKIVKNDQSR